MCLAGSKSVAFVTAHRIVEEPRLPSGKLDLFGVWWEEKNEESLWGAFLAGNVQQICTEQVHICMGVSLRSSYKQPTGIQLFRRGFWILRKSAECR